MVVNKEDYDEVTVPNHNLYYVTKEDEQKNTLAYLGYVENILIANTVNELMMLVEINSKYFAEMVKLIQIVKQNNIGFATTFSNILKHFSNLKSKNTTAFKKWIYTTRNYLLFLKSSVNNEFIDRVGNILSKINQILK